MPGSRVVGTHAQPPVVAAHKLKPLFANETMVPRLKMAFAQVQSRPTLKLATSKLVKSTTG